MHITIHVLQTNFGISGNLSEFIFNTATDEIGPYHIVAPNNESYLLFEASASVRIPGITSSLLFPGLYIDNLDLEMQDSSY